MTAMDRGRQNLEIKIHVSGLDTWTQKKKHLRDGFLKKIFKSYMQRREREERKESKGGKN